MKRVVSVMWAATLSGALGAGHALAQSQPAASSAVYRCPGNPVLYTDAISAKEAKDRGCRVLEGAPITVIQPPQAQPGREPPASIRSTSARATATLGAFSTPS